MFFVFEGVDGCGKSTQSELLAGYLKDRSGRDVLHVHEPGGTELGEELRQILLKPADEELSARTELFLFMAARSHLVQHRILPALAAGRVVISDRFLWSSAAYQAASSDLTSDVILDLGRLAIQSVEVTQTFLIDLDPEIAWQRTSSRDRIEDRGLDFQRRVRANFQALAETYPERVSVIDGRREAEEIHREIVEQVEVVLANSDS